MSVKEEICSFENLYRGMQKCKSGVMWKDSTAGFVKNGLVNCLDLRRDLLSGKYKIGKYTVFAITEPKVRVIVSTRIRDRTFQRSLCDNYLTEAISKSFIYDNCACQSGKGTDFARNRLKAHLQKFYRKHGREGYVLKCDIKNYFGSTPHEVAIAAVRKRAADEWACDRTAEIINSFTQGENPNIGMDLGSQVTQLIELAVLDDLDHFIKEKLHIKHYIRYMDDFILIHEDKEYLLYCKRIIADKLAELGLTLNAKKTQIFPLKQPLKFLGFSFKLTETGKVLMFVLPEKVTHERRKLRKLVYHTKCGIMTREEVDKCFEAWKAHASKGNSYNLIKSMEKYYNELWRDCNEIYFYWRSAPQGACKKYQAQGAGGAQRR
ncbi:RNA-directed DNA polymerase [Ruminococcus sp.]|uniref:RNA-directed DNA polymerase n=1 Tax=Ruminococcus sp. TaxID=41978 RepID=UPI0025E86E2B|nr:RNA-directed DNA polymerase [Ruminococcus sp.]MBQ8965876.1 RNA-directed DNA polymerase [Ruminococcus sp.]